MKKSYFWGLLLAIMALIPAQNAFAFTYCDPTGTTSGYGGYYYGIGSFTLSVNGVEALAPTVNADVCNWYDSKTFEMQAGDVLDFSFSFVDDTKVRWEALAIFVDWNQDGTFDNDDASDEKIIVFDNPGLNYPTTAQIIVPDDFAWADGNSELGVRIVSGEAYTHKGVAAINPCSRLVYGSVVTVKAVKPVAVVERTITFDVTPVGAGTLSNYSETSTLAISSVATAVTGFKFVNWTLEGEVVTTNPTITDNTEGDKTYVANFEFDPTLDRSGWEATASSYENDGEGAAGGWPKHTIDGQTTTFWHSDYSVNPHPTAPHWLQYNLGSVQKFTSFNYVSRDEKSTNIGCNGNAKTYKLYVSNSDISANLGAGYVPNGLTAISEGEFVYDGVSAEHVVDLGAEYQGQYVFLLITDSWNSSTVAKYGNCAEFYLYYEPTAPMQERTITVVSEDENKGTVTGGGTGSEPIVISATANSGYRFLNWTVEGSVVSETANYTDNTEGDKTYTANFVKVYNVTATATNGTVQVSGQNSEGTFDEGATATLVATPSEGYAFVNWTLNGEIVGESATLNVTVTADAEYVAVFEKTYVTNFGTSTNANKGALTSITFNIDGNVQTIETGKTSSSGAIYVDKLSEVITIEAGTQVNSLTTEGHVGNDWMHGYLFVDWNGDKSFTRDLNEWVPTDESELIAYGFWVGQDGDSSHGNVNDETGYNHLGEVLTEGSRATNGVLKAFTIPSDIPAGDYRARYKLDWNCVNPDATLDTNMGAMVLDFTLRVTQPVPPTVYAVSVATADEAMGTAEVSATEVEEGEEVTFTATAAEGYQFVNWTSGEGVVSTENPYTVAVTAEMALTANFELIPVTKYTVTVNAGVGGTAEASATEVEEGQTVTLTATAEDGYAFANWTSSAESVYYIQNYNTGKYLGYNTVNLAAIDNQTSDVTFTPSTMREGDFTIFLTNATYNQESPAKQISYMHCGSSGRFSGNPVNTDAAQQIAIFKVEDPAAETITATKVTEITSGATYMFVGLKSEVYYALTDELYNANHTTDQRMVGAAVTITDGTLTYTGDANVLWTIVNKSVVSTENPYTVTVTSNIDMTANFVEVPVVKYAVSAEASPAEAGNVTISATEVEENGTVDLTATANTGYEFVNWTVEGTEVSTDASFTATVTAETAYVANFVAQEFTITYMVDGEEYASETYAFGATVTPVAVPAEKEGYTFSGWSEIPATMPAENVTVTGTFAVNSYDIVYYVDGEEYETETYAFGATVTPVAEPTKAGYTFSGWSEIPATMPAENVTVTGTFAVNSYDIVYYVDGEEYATETYEFGATIAPVAEPTKDGYTFSGWSEIPTTMPAENVTVTGTFAVNSYDIVYYVDGEEYETETYEFGATVTPVAEPTKDGYTFSGWSEIPATMPAENVEVTGTFTIVIKENVEVTDDNKEENANATYANVTVANEKVWDIKANTISADKVSVSVSATGAAPQIKIEDGGKVTAALEVNRVVKKGEWAMMALPFAVDLANVTVDGVAAQNNVNIKVMVYDAAKRANESIELWTKSGWVDLQGTTIAANQGFAVAVNAQNGDEQTVTFASAPQTYDGADKEVALDRHASTVNAGADADWNFFGNPTLANAEKGANYALYIYNAEDDSYDEYASSDVVTCQPYAAMFAQSADDFNTLSFSNGTAGILNDANGVFGEMQFSLNGEDEARVVLSDEASEEYVRNEDALYFAAPNANLAQLYIVKGNIKMAVSEQPELSESIALGYKAAKAGEQTLTLTSLPDNASVVLKDNVTGDEVALTVGDSYTFESAAGTFNNRFVVTTTDLTGIAQATANGEIKVVVNGDDINVYGAEAGTEVVAYTTNGTVVASAVAEEGVTTLSTSANGVIIVKVANTAVKVIK